MWFCFQFTGTLVTNLIVNKCVDISLVKEVRNKRLKVAPRSYPEFYLV